jgi:hypothetical protein
LDKSLGEHRDGLGTVNKRNISCLFRESNPLPITPVRDQEMLTEFLIGKPITKILLEILRHNWKDSFDF